MLKVYCLNFENEYRKMKMEKKFNDVGITDYYMYPGVPLTDPRILKLNPNPNCALSIFFGHLDMIQMFVESEPESEYAIFCEDDLMLHKNIVEIVPFLVEKMKDLDLEILLMGSLLNYKPNSENLLDKMPPSLFYSYSDGHWGAQMYILRKDYARRLLDPDFLKENEDFLVADFYITQRTLKKALIYPMLAVEDIEYILTKYEECRGQKNFHMSCHLFCYDKDFFI
jgi:GR25 family glycosyltransferase involved in LPS biosynthesis